MTREEAIANLGTIARSGHRGVLQVLSGDQQKDSQLIGQFGVGFYSAFIVADRVEVLSRKAGEPAEAGVHWESGADGEFTVETVTQAAARHRRHAAPEGGCQGVRRPLPAARPDPPLLGPHRLPGAHAQGGRGLARVRGRQPGARRCGRCRAPRSRTRSTGSSTSTSRTTSPIRSPGATTRSRASANTPACCTSPAVRPSTCGSAMPRAA